MAVLALDAKFNVFRSPDNPQFRTLYIRRRSQILREKSKFEQPDPTVLKDYLKIRSSLLSQRYGMPLFSDQGSIRSHTLSLRSNSKYNMYSSDENIARMRSEMSRLQNDFVQRFHLDNDNSQVITPTSLAEASRAMAGERSISENYSFSGVHHIFDQHRESVTSVKFAHDDKSRLACSSLDGQISIFQIIPPPSTIICSLQGHTAGVTDFVWSLSNDTILSCSLDGSSRLWQVASGRCLRVIPNPNESEVLACLFQPINNNLFAIGDSKQMLQVFNLSTGKVVKGGTSNLPGQVLSLCFDSSGKILWAGDSKGNVNSFLFDLITGRLIRAKRTSICEGHPVTSISSRSWVNREARDPLLLVNCAANALFLFRVTGSEGGLQLRRRFPTKHKDKQVRSTFCPLMSFRPGACVVSGSEDSSVYFFDVAKDDKPCINTLQGHSGPVLDVSFAPDESMLASCDSTGIVIVWKREQKGSRDNL